MRSDYVARGYHEAPKSPSRNNRIDFELYLKSRLVNKALAELGNLKKRYRKRASKIERLFLDGPLSSDFASESCV